jgi:hypothetical protein
VCGCTCTYYSCELGNTLMFYESCLTQIRHLVAADAVGMSTPEQQELLSISLFLMHGA